MQLISDRALLIIALIAIHIAFLMSSIRVFQMSWSATDSLMIAVLSSSLFFLLCVAVHNMDKKHARRRLAFLSMLYGLKFCLSLHEGIGLPVTKTNQAEFFKFQIHPNAALLNKAQLIHDTDDRPSTALRLFQIFGVFDPGRWTNNSAIISTAFFFLPDLLALLLETCISTIECSVKYPHHNRLKKRKTVIRRSKGQTIAG